LKKLPTRKLAGALGIAFGAGLLVFGALSLPWRGERAATPPQIRSSAWGSGPLKAGAAEAPIAVQADASIGGFPRVRWRSAGVRNPVAARALYLEAPGCRVAVASVEVLLLTEPIVRQAEQRLADLGLDALVVGATHTHAGPGGYWDDFFAEHAALGPYDPRAAAAVVDAIEQAVRGAAAASTPATLEVARGSAEALVWARSKGRVDARMLSLQLTSVAGPAVAELLVFGAHPTTLGKANRLLSGDWPGRLRPSLRRGLRIVLQGAIGDQSANVPPGDAATRPERYAEAVDRADDALPSARVPEPVTLAAATATVTLPAPWPGFLPAWLRPAARTVAWNRLPPTATITALRVGPLRLVALPAEPTAEITERWRAAAGDGVEIASLSGGAWLGYVDTAARTRSGEGEAARTYYGPELADRLQAGVLEAARAVDRRPDQNAAGAGGTRLDDQPR
jgi:hypothetical protein